MAMGSKVTLNEIPFFDLSQAGGKFCWTSMFYVDGDWRVWIPLGDGQLLEIKAWAAESCYFGDRPERESDVYFHFLDFIAQKASYHDIAKPVRGLHDDVNNLSASLAKISHIHETKSALKSGDSRMVVTEVEYLFSVCRSMIDLFQEIAFKLWEKLTIIVDYLPEKKPLRKSFREMIHHNGRLTSKEELQARFGLPDSWAEFYLTHAEFFLQVRKFRDNIVHHGSQVSTIFSGEDGYYVDSNFKPFEHMKIWRESDRGTSNLFPLMPGLGIVVLKTLLICEDFSQMMERTFQFPTPIAPGLRLYTRGYFDENFVAVINDAGVRYNEFSQAEVQ